MNKHSVGVVHTGQGVKSFSRSQYERHRRCWESQFCDWEEFCKGVGKHGSVYLFKRSFRFSQHVSDACLELYTSVSVTQLENLDAERLSPVWVGSVAAGDMNYYFDKKNEPNRPNQGSKTATWSELWVLWSVAPLHETLRSISWSNQLSFTFMKLFHFI